MFDELFVCSKHTYTLAATGLRKFETKEFSTRQEANEVMYKYIGKHSYKVNKVYDDKHSKTYVCDNGVRFYVNRV